MSEERYRVKVETYKPCVNHLGFDDGWQLTQIFSMHCYNEETKEKIIETVREIINNE